MLSLCLSGCMCSASRISHVGSMSSSCGKFSENCKTYPSRQNVVSSQLAGIYDKFGYPKNGAPLNHS